MLIVLLALSLVALGVAISYRYGSAAASNVASVHAPANSAPGREAPTASQPPQASAVRPRLATASDPLAVTALHVKFPESGPQTFRYASASGPVLGMSGSIRRFRIAIEANIKVVDMATFTAKINKTLGDPRSWIASGRYRLQEVPSSAPAEFTVYLATPATTTRMCAPLQVHDFTSCRQGSHVVLNLARWMTSIPGYIGAKVVLDTYRTYMINHEVGHALGHGHELCPGPGRLSPVMEQQTLGMHGCKPNPWPFVKGKRYDGPAGEY
jgi:hypothetical protein